MTYATPCPCLNAVKIVEEANYKRGMKHESWAAKLTFQSWCFESCLKMWSNIEREDCSASVGIEIGPSVAPNKFDPHVAAEFWEYHAGELSFEGFYSLTTHYFFYLENQTCANGLNNTRSSSVFPCFDSVVIFLAQWRNERYRAATWEGWTLVIPPSIQPIPRKCTWTSTSSEFVRVYWTFALGLPLATCWARNSLSSYTPSAHWSSGSFYRP